MRFRPWQRTSARALLASAVLFAVSVVEVLGNPQHRQKKDCPPPCPVPEQILAPTKPETTRKPEAKPEVPPVPVLTEERFGALASETVALAETAIPPGAYLDSAIPKNTLRLRYDAAFDINRPDRAEFYYATWHELALHLHGIQGGGAV